MAADEEPRNPTIYGPLIPENRGTIEISYQFAEQACDVRGLPNPYLGLRSFTYAERARYAGREHTVAAAVQQLTTPGAERALLFVTGASGSGKSSFAQAGLLPMLESFYAQRGVAARCAVMRPGRYPLASLRDGMQQIGLPAHDLDRDTLRQSPETFARMLREHTPAQQINLLILDQFEELFTQAAPGERDALFGMLETLPPFTALRTHLIATLRADYLPDLFARPTLYEHAKQGIDLRAMTEAELTVAIQRPLQQLYPHGDKHFEDALLQRLAHDAAADAAYLPLLQVTLEDLWARGSLKLSAYRTLTDAIQQRAEDVCACADHAGARQQPRSAADQSAIMHIFLDLVEVSLDDDPRRDVRRRRTLAELRQNNADRARLIEDLVAARLLSASDETDGAAHGEVIDIIHESLIANWARLRQAIATQRAVLQQRVRFEQALREWHAHDRADEYLLEGVRLAEAQELEQRGDIALHSAAAQELLRRSVAMREAARQRELEQAQALIVEQQRRVRTLRWSALLLMVLLALAVAAALYAQHQRRLMQEQLNISESKRLAGLAQSQPAAARVTAMLLAIEAVLRNSNPDSEQALRDVLVQETWTSAPLRANTAMQSAIYSPDGQRMLTASEGSEQQLWDLAGRLLGAGKVDSDAFSPDGSTLMTVSGGTVSLWDRQATLQLRFDTGAAGPPLSAQFSPDGQLILTAAGGTVSLWDRQGTLRARFDAGARFAPLFSPDGQRMLTIADRTVDIWNRDGTRRASIAARVTLPDAAAFSPDSQRILLGFRDGTAGLFAPDGQALATLKGHTHAVDGVAFSPDGQRMLTKSADGTVRLWDETGRFLALLDDSNMPHIDHVLFSPDSQRVLVVMTNGNAQLWDRDGQHATTIYEFSGPYIYAPMPMFSRDGQLIVSVYNNDRTSEYTARLWDADGRRIALLRGHTARVSSAVFSPEGGRILTASADGTARQYLVRADDLRAVAECQVWRGLTDEEIRRFGIDSPRFDFSQRRCPPTLSWQQQVR